MSEEGDQALHLYARQLSRDALENENQRLRGIVPEVLERLNDELCAENATLRTKLLDVAMSLKVCAWALRRGTAPELGERALELLKKHDILGSVLRKDDLCQRKTGPNGEACGLVPPCPDCGLACHDVPIGA